MSDPQSHPDAETFRDYLLMVARATLGLEYRQKIGAEDVVNQTLFDAHRQRDDYRGASEAQFVAWLRQMLSDNIKDAVRYCHRDKRDVSREHSLAVGGWDQSYSRLMDLAGDITSPSMRAIKHERELQLAAALAQLPDRQREAVELRHLHGLSLAATADALDSTPATAAGLLRRGLTRLREILQETRTGSFSPP